MKNIVHHYTTDELLKICEDMTSELQRADRGESTSIPYIRHALAVPEKTGIHRVNSLVIGGTNAASAMVTIRDGSIDTGPVIRIPLPILETREVLLSLCDRLLAPDAKLAGINFAYHLIPSVRDGRLDGILNRGTKYHRLDGLVGVEVGAAIENHLASHGRSIRCVVANDTICLLLSGLSRSAPRGLVAGIVGTGFNFGFFRENDVIINLECGSFNAFRQSESGIVIDRASDNPGDQRWEKEIAGAYLYRHFNVLAQTAGLREQADDTAALSRLAAGHGRAADIARNLFIRSARLVAVQIASLYRFLDLPHLAMVLEGSLYWSGWQYRDIVSETLTQLGIGRDRVSICAIEESSIVGAAWLALTGGAAPLNH